MKKAGMIFVVLILIFLVWLLKNTNSPEQGISPVTGEVSNDIFALEVKEPFTLEKLKSFELPIIIDFGADWCPPCRQMKPHFKKLYETYKGKAIIKYVDVDEQPKLSSEFPGQYIPTQAFFNKDGTPYVPQNFDKNQFDYYYDDNKNHILTMHVGGLTFEQMEQMLKEMGIDG